MSNATSLDINTPRGRIAAQDQENAARIVFGESSGSNRYKFVRTSDTDRAAVDGIVFRDWTISSVCEIKSRDCDYDTLMNEFHGEWLLTYQKLLDLQKVCQLLCVPGYGLLYLKGSQEVVVLKLVNESGHIACKFRIQRTETQATCNGGKAIRENAYIDVRGGRVYDGATA